MLGNKGSTDQHSYIQQLRDGLSNFFVDVYRGSAGPKPANQCCVEPDVTAGDYLDGFFLGTRQAFIENGGESVTITIREVNPFSIGLLIALFERAVGLYAS